MLKHVPAFPSTTRGKNGKDGNREGIGKKMQANARRLDPPSEPETNGLIDIIHEKYDTGLRRFVSRRLDSKQDIDDVTQDVYLRLIRHSRPNELRPSLALLCTIASNLIKDRFRSARIRKAEAHIPLESVELVSPPASPEQILRAKDAVAGFIGVFESLNPNCRRAFLLHRFKNLTYNGIAKEMGISKSMVKKHISHALSELRKTAGAHIGDA